MQRNSRKAPYNEASVEGTELVRIVVRHAVLAVLFGALSARAEPAPPGGARAIDVALSDLSGDVRAIAFAVRPGAEDLATLAALRFGGGVKTTVVFATRGEAARGDRDAGTPEELAAIRTGEALSAAEAVGAEALFLELPDPGAVRTAEDAFGHWNREALTARVVGLLRALRPRYVFAAGPAEEERGGEAALAAVLAEAAALAADAARFPEAGPPHAGTKLYLSTAGPAGTAPAVDAIDPVSGLTYSELGRLAERSYSSLAPTAGGWPAAPLRRAPLYREFGAEPPAGVVRLELAPDRPEWLDPDARRGPRRELVGRVAATPAGPARTAALAALLGADLGVEAAAASAVPLSAAAVRVRFVNRGPFRLSVEGLLVSTPFGAAVELSGGAVDPGGAIVHETAVAIPEEAAPTRPLVDRLREAGRHHLQVRAVVRCADPEIAIEVASRGELPIWPRLSFAPATRDRLFRPVEGESDFRVVATNHAPEEIEVAIEAEILGTDRIEVRAPPPFALPAGRSRTVALRLAVREDHRPGRYALEIRARGAAPARTELLVLDVEAPEEIRVGVVRTVGDDAYGALQRIGMRPDLLTDEDLAIADLATYDTIWIGADGFRARPMLVDVAPRLLEYVEKGGNLVVNAVHPASWSASYAPHRLVVGGEVVTREDAPIEFPLPTHRLLHAPNTLVAADFEGFVGERGRWFPAEWDVDEYDTVIATWDPARPPVPAILATTHGRGTYVYVALSLSRQLQHLNPAAYKLLANLVSWPWRR